MRYTYIKSLERGAGMLLRTVVFYYSMFFSVHGTKSQISDLEKYFFLSYELICFLF